ADGDFDVYVTNIDFDGRHNRLYRNETAGGVVSFSEVAMAAAVAYTGWGWGATFLDGDNDGTLDLAVTNGWTSGAYTTDQSKFFANQNDDPVTFADVSATVAFDDTYRASSLIAADLDRDGDLDLVQTVLPVALPTPKSPQLRLLQNLLIENGSTDAFLTVRPRMPGLNSHAIGAVVKVVVGASETIRLITAGTSYLGQEPAEAVFGLGDNQQADRLVIDWPDGTTSSWTNVTANQTLTLTAEPLPLLYASPKAIAYGNVPVGDDAASPLTLSNATAGSGSLQVTAITLSDPANFWIDPAGGSAPCGVTTPSIPAGASCTMSVHLTPLAAASLTTELTIDSDSAGGPEVVTLTGCSGAATVQLSNTVIDTTELHEACGTLTVGPDVQVTDTGRATLRARAVTLGDDVSVTGGGELTVVTVAPTD
ncbi:MAG: ASPIC/UnbV domain-containing protein, partial [Thermoanaerobaculia bacterium]